MYDELIKRLRTHNGWALNKTLDEAADAIEELSKYANTIMQLKSEGWYLQQYKYCDGYAAIATMPFPELQKEKK